MATGSYDANGIWQYGEDDNIALFSDTLNKLADSTSDAFTSDRSRLSTLEAGSLAGLIPVVPATVTAVTGTASTNALGTVTFTGCSKISLDGVFTSAYRNYKIVFAISGSSANTSLIFRYKKNGTEYTGAQYNFGGQAFRDSGSTTAFVGQTQSSQSISWVNGPASGVGSGNGVIDLYQPFGNTYQSNTTYFRGGDNSSMAGIFTGSTCFSGQTNDGFSLYVGTGTFGGQFTVYGYND